MDLQIAGTARSVGVFLRKDEGRRHRTMHEVFEGVLCVLSKRRSDGSRLLMLWWA